MAGAERPLGWRAKEGSGLIVLWLTHEGWRSRVWARPFIGLGSVESPCFAWSSSGTIASIQAASSRNGADVGRERGGDPGASIGRAGTVEEEEENEGAGASHR